MITALTRRYSRRALPQPNLTYPLLHGTGRYDDPCGYARLSSARKKKPKR